MHFGCPRRRIVLVGYRCFQEQSPGDLGLIRGLHFLRLATHSTHCGSSQAVQFLKNRSMKKWGSGVIDAEAELSSYGDHLSRPS